MIIGDLDSLLPGKVDEIRNRSIKIIKHPAEKNESDLELAIDTAVKMNPSKIIILGATGKRTDQTLLNIFLLLKYDKINITIKNIREEIFLASNNKEIYAPSGATVSLIPLTTEVSGIVTEGFMYELHDEPLRKASSRGMSNVLIEPPGRIRYKRGKLLLIVNKEEV